MGRKPASTEVATIELIHLSCKQMSSFPLSPRRLPTTVLIWIPLYNTLLERIHGDHCFMTLQTKPNFRLYIFGTYLIDPRKWSFSAVTPTLRNMSSKMTSVSSLEFLKVPQDLFMSAGLGT